MLCLGSQFIWSVICFQFLAQFPMFLKEVDSTEFSHLILGTFLSSVSCYFIFPFYLIYIAVVHPSLPISFPSLMS